MELWVTTCKGPSEVIVARAEEVASRLGAPLHIRRRGSVASLFRATGASLLYIIGWEREEVRDVSGEVFFVHPGLFFMRRADGEVHPLTRAVSPEGRAGVRRLVDGTLGAAGDALHLAWWLRGAEVVGLEASAALHALQEEGLGRMARAVGEGYAEAAGRIRAEHGEALRWLASQAPGSADVVYLDPMFEAPQAAQSGFGLLRRLAHGAPLTGELLEAASRVARQRVVVKVPGVAPVPSLGGAEEAFNRRVRSRAVDFLIVEKVLQAPEWEGGPTDR